MARTRETLGMAMTAAVRGAAQRAPMRTAEEVAESMMLMKVSPIDYRLEGTKTDGMDVGASLSDCESKTMHDLD